MDVQILDGHSAGARATTNSVGVYSFGRFQILTGEVFMIRASKQGYQPSTKTHRVNFPFDPANPPFLDYVLPPLEAPRAASRPSAASDPSHDEVRMLRHAPPCLNRTARQDVNESMSDQKRAVPPRFKQGE